MIEFWVGVLVGAVGLLLIGFALVLCVGVGQPHRTWPEESFKR